MIAVSILSIMSLTLLQVRNNNTHLNSYFISKNKASSLMSMVSYYYDDKSHNKNLHLDAKVQKEFIINDKIRQYLKEFNLLYVNKVVSTVDLLEDTSGDDNNETIEEETEEQDVTTTENMLLAVKVQQINITDENVKAFFYNLEFE